MDSKVHIKEIISILPHRYPFLMVDKVEEIIVGKSIIAVKNITINEPQFMGHFPNNPVMPGVMMVEAMAQAAAILVAKSSTDFTDKEVLLLSVDNAKFRKVVVPGDRLILEVETVQSRGAVWKFKGRATVEGTLVAESSFTAMIQNKIELEK